MNLFKLIGNLGNISKMQQEIQETAAELGQRRYEGKAGGGMVQAVATGGQELVSLTIDPKLIADNDKELLEDLIISAANEALREAKQQTAEQMQKRLTEKFDLPEMQGLLGSLLSKTT